jgi:hypothetical protein
MKHMLSWQINEFGVLTAFTSPFLGEGSSGLTQPVTTAERLSGSIPFARGLFRVSGYGQKQRRWWDIAKKQREKARMKLGLNKTVRDMTDRRWTLQRVHSQATLKPDERKAYAVLEKWYQKVYLPLTKKMNAARKRGDQSSMNHWQRILEESTAKWRKELTDE